MKYMSHEIVLEQRVSVWLSTLLIALLSAVVTAALAQEQSDEVDVEKPRALQAVTVTAQKREENIQDVPVSVAVLSGEALDVLGSGGFDIRQLSSRLPSLQIESSFGRAFPRFYIRGLGNTDFDLNASQPVSLVFDGVLQENPILKGFPLWSQYTRRDSGDGVAQAQPARRWLRADQLRPF
jgi:iron complex outermembrane receptor protein